MGIHTYKQALSCNLTAGKVYCDAGPGPFEGRTPCPCRPNMMFRARLGMGRLLRWRLLPWYTLFWLGMGALQPHHNPLHFRCPPDLQCMNSCDSFRASLRGLPCCFPLGPAQAQRPGLSSAERPDVRCQMRNQSITVQHSRCCGTGPATNVCCRAVRTLRAILGCDSPLALDSGICLCRGDHCTLNMLR